MRLGILETGKVPVELYEKHGSYPNMFVQLLSERDLELEFAFYAVVDGVLPETVTECDAWLITGSRHGAYESHAWIPPLEHHIRQSFEKNIPILGICFGHQVIAQALGGKVIQSEKGWGLGVHQYTITDAAEWMEPAQTKQVAINVIHQDQVVEVPESARVLASSEFCPNAMLAYGDTIFTVQAHPEIEPEYEADLINLRRGSVFSDEMAEAALASMTISLDNHLVADWMINFLKRQR